METRRRFPEAGALARARALLLEAGLAVPMNDWASLATICDTPWLPAPRRTTASAMRIARRRVQPLPGRPPVAATLWRTRTERASDGVWLVEEGEDLLLADSTGGRVVVLAE